MRAALKRIADDANIFSRMGKAIGESVGSALEPVQNWIVRNGARIAAVGDVSASFSTGMALASDAPGVPLQAKAILKTGATVMALGALTAHGTAKVAGADVSNRSLFQDVAGGLGAASVFGTLGARFASSKFSNRAGFLGTADSVSAAGENPSSLRHFAPRDTRQKIMMFTGVSFVVPFENAWRDGGKK